MGLNYFLPTSSSSSSSSTAKKAQSARSIETEDSAQVHQTHFFARGRVWERDYPRPRRLWLETCQHSLAGMHAMAPAPFPSSRVGSRNEIRYALARQNAEPSLHRLRIREKCG